MKKKFFFLFIFFIFWNFIFSQEKTILEIPSLESLIDSAIVNSPLLKQQESSILSEKYKKDMIKTEWLKFIKPQFQFSYGSAGNTAYYDEEGTYFASEETSSISSSFSVSLRLSVDLKTIADNKKKLLIANEKIKSQKFKREIIINSIRKDILKAYNKVILSQKLLNIQSQLFQAQLVQKQLAEEQFKNAEISLSEYTSVISLISNSMAQYEKTKMEFRNSYLLLEELIGLRINDIKFLNDF